MSGFKNRIQQGKELEEYLNNFLIENKIAFFNTGYEFYKSNYGAFELLKTLKDNTSNFIRYYPDKTLVGKKSILIEVKNSTGLEKQCYDNYLNLNNSGVQVLLFLKNKKLCKLQDVKFKKLQEFDSKAQMDIPILEEVWKHPKGLKSQVQYQQYLNAYHGKTSGNTFAYFDFNKIKFYDLNCLLSL